MPDKIQVLLVDDEKLIRQGLRLLLSGDSRLEIIGEAGNGKEALAFCQTQRVDLVLMDIRMPEMDGREATLRIKEQFPNIEILILTTFSDMEYIKEAMRNGAKGYLLKDSSPELIQESIVAVSSGSVVVHPDVADKLLQEDQTVQAKMPIDAMPYDEALNESELEIIKLLASGHNNKEIAEQVYLSEGTIKNRISILLQKLDLRDRTQLAIFAWKHGLL